MKKTKTVTPAKIQKEVERILTKARQEPRFRVSRERDALIHAIGFGKREIAQRLIEAGVDVNTPDTKGRTVLWHAARAGGQGNLVRELIRRGTKLPDDVLMGPVCHDDVETVRFLIRRGANVNCMAMTLDDWKFPKKEVLLTVALENASSERGAEKTVAAMIPEMTSRQRAKLPPQEPKRDFEAIPIMLIKAGAEVNRLAYTYSLQEGFICTILALAVGHGFARTVKAMLAAGADANIKDTWGGTPLFHAALFGRRDMAKILLKAGADVRIKRKDGYTAAAFARREGYTDLADELERIGK